MNKIEAAQESSQVYKFLEQHATTTIPWVSSMIVNDVRQIPIQSNGFEVTVTSLNMQPQFPITPAGYLRNIFVTFNFSTKFDAAMDTVGLQCNIEDVLNLVSSVKFRANGGRIISQLDSVMWATELYRERNRYSRYIHHGLVSATFLRLYPNPLAQAGNLAYETGEILSVRVPVPYGFLEKLRSSFDFTNLRDGTITVELQPGFDKLILRRLATDKSWYPVSLGARLSTTGPAVNMIEMSIGADFDYMVPNPSAMLALQQENRAVPGGKQHLIGTYEDGGMQPVSFNTSLNALTDYTEYTLITPYTVKNSVRALTAIVSVENGFVNIANPINGRLSRWGAELTGGASLKNPIRQIVIRSSGTEIYSSNESQADAFTFTPREDNDSVFARNAMSAIFYEDGCKATDYGQVLPTANLANCNLEVTFSDKIKWSDFKDQVKLYVVSQTQSLMSMSEDTKVIKVTAMA